MRARVCDWFRERTGLGPETYRALNRPLPQGIGWWDTLGAVALALLVLQGVTGVFLAMYYSPDPERAHASLRFIHQELPLGRLVHGLHVYGDSALFLVVLLHLVRSYWVGAYKRPRELTWLLGIVMLQLVIGFGFTGYLLPWDQKAYYATQVRIAYAEGIPLIGPATAALLRGGPDIGAMTTTRFYALHALLLPAILLPILLAYLSLVGKHGYTAPGARVGEEAEVPEGSRFLDHHLLKVAVGVLIAFGAVYALAWLRPAELEFPADVNDSTYHPRPEWYFLWLFQIVTDWKNVPLVGGIGWVPVIVLPGIAITILALAPWLDRTPERRAAKRPLMVGVLAFGLVTAAAFTVRAYSQLRPNATPEHSLYAEYTDGGARPLDASQVAAGKTAFARCGGCHAAYGDFSGKAGPQLTGYGLKTFLTEVKGRPEAGRLPFGRRFAEYTRGTLRPPDTKMPNYPADQLSDVELRAIGAYLSQAPPPPRLPQPATAE